ncbi:MAG: M50 family metallopeptidase, partial [Oceanicaulis sp.]
MVDLLGSGLLSVFAFVAVISFVVVIHELGHYWAGRLFGVHAEVFSIGMGPGLFGWTDRLGTRWTVAALPLGGYVRFRGDENAASAPDREALARLRRDHQAPDTVFHFKPVWQRAAIVAAGPVMNFVLAVLLFGVLGVMRGEAYIEPVVGAVVEGGAADEAGFEPGDRILAVDGRELDDFFTVMQYVTTRAGVEMTFTVERDGRTLAIDVTPERVVREDGLGGERGRGFLGLGVAEDADRGREPVSL